MSKSKKKKETGDGNVPQADPQKAAPPVDPEIEARAHAAATFALALDLAIPLALGLRAEVMDDCIKLWPNEVAVPDETNFLIGDRFSQSLEATRHVLDGFGAYLEVRKHNDQFIGVITSGDSGELTSPPSETAELAGATVMYALLWALRKGKHKS